MPKENNGQWKEKNEKVVESKTVQKNQSLFMKTVF